MSASREPFSVVQSAVVPILRNDIDTDQIIPARFLKTVNRAGLADQLFNDWRSDPGFVLNDPRMAGRQILLAGDNFGCGSSREHAPWALTAWGFRAVVSSSFADIFRNNALKNSLLPVAVQPDELVELERLVAAHPDAELVVDLQTQELRKPDGSSLAFSVDPFARQMLLAGTDELGYLLSLAPQIEAYEASHRPRISTLS
jgi:3-isopropylmalate/(R)-2-methylmalate dehydratase small subunit